MLKRFIPFFLLLILAASVFANQQYKKYREAEKQKKVLATQTQKHAPPDYLIILVGDSMTQYIGNSTEMRQFLADYYPGKTFDIYNYGFGSTNIQTVPYRLTQWTNRDRPYQPILDIDFDLIIIESMGHNPLSSYPREEGLRKQTETLDEIVRLIKDRRPSAKIAFLTTISPNSKTYAHGVADLTPEVRKIWVEERSSFIKNHAEFAKSRGIPLINVFDKSLNKEGDGDLQYIEDKNYIHPSPKGIILLQKEIADFIYNNNLLN